MYLLHSRTNTRQCRTKHERYTTSSRSRAVLSNIRSIWKHGDQCDQTDSYNITTSIQSRWSADILFTCSQAICIRLEMYTRRLSCVYTGHVDRRSIELEHITEHKRYEQVCCSISIDMSIDDRRWLMIVRTNDKQCLLTKTKCSSVSNSGSLSSLVMLIAICQRWHSCQSNRHVRYSLDMFREHRKSFPSKNIRTQFSCCLSSILVNKYWTLPYIYIYFLFLTCHLDVIRV
jgi:hypothetical protein